MSKNLKSFEKGFSIVLSNLKYEDESSQDRFLEELYIDRLQLVGQYICQQQKPIN
jgi:hypothetical protein